MKTITILFLCLTSSLSYAQELDTLLANSTHNLSLFFPSPIRQAVTGSENFTFSYDRESAKHFGLLQATPGTKSNLLVVTSDGSAYSFLLEFQEKLSVLNRFVTLKESIGNENGNLDTISDTIAIMKPLTTPIHTNYSYREEYFKKFSAYHIERPRMPLASKRKDKLVLRLLDLVYDRSEVYAVLEIENRSDIDFEVDYLNIFKVNGNRRRKSSYQKLVLHPIFKYNFPEMVRVGKRRRFVYILPKFTLGTAEKLIFRIREASGSRSVELRIRNH